MHPRSDSERSYYDYVLLKVGQNLRDRRERAGLTQREVSGLIAARIGKAFENRRGGLSEAYYRGIESGNKEASLCRLLLIGDVLDMQPWQLFAGALTTEQIRDRL